MNKTNGFSLPTAVFLYISHWGGGGGGGKKLPTSSPLQTEQGNSNGGNNSEETKPVNSQKKWQKNTRGNPPLQREGEM